jgi:hypothetical protein
MSRHEKLLMRVLSGRSDANIEFEELDSLLQRLGFSVRVRGSHHVFVLPGTETMLNLQRDGHLAKSYQVRQVRTAILAHGLVPDVEENT